jgi:hypothetical protein
VRKLGRPCFLCSGVGRSTGSVPREVSACLASADLEVAGRRGRAGSAIAGFQSSARLRAPVLLCFTRARDYQRSRRRASRFWSRTSTIGSSRVVSLGPVVESEVVRGLVVCLSRDPELVRASAASRAVGSVEGAGDLGVAPRAHGLAEAHRPSADRSARPRVACRLEPGAATPDVGGILGAAGDAAALAPGAGGAALDVSA